MRIILFPIHAPLLRIVRPTGQATANLAAIIIAGEHRRSIHSLLIVGDMVGLVDLEILGRAGRREV